MLHRNDVHLAPLPDQATIRRGVRKIRLKWIATPLRPRFVDYGRTRSDCRDGVMVACKQTVG
jgi:hypothetical protein